MKITDIDTGKKSDIEQGFKTERDWIVAQAWQLMIEIEHVNRKRFSENPIDVSFDGFDLNLKKLMDSGESSPYFRMRKEREKQGWL